MRMAGGIASILVCAGFVVREAGGIAIVLVCAGFVVREAGGIASILVCAGFVVREAGGIASTYSVCRLGDNDTAVNWTDCMLWLSEGRAEPPQTCY